MVSACGVMAVMVSAVSTVSATVSAIVSATLAQDAQESNSVLSEAGDMTMLAATQNATLQLGWSAASQEDLRVLRMFWGWNQICLTKHCGIGRLNMWKPGMQIVTWIQSGFTLQVQGCCKLGPSFQTRWGKCSFLTIWSAAYRSRRNLYSQGDSK